MASKAGAGHRPAASILNEDLRGQQKAILRLSCAMTGRFQTPTPHMRKISRRKISKLERKEEGQHDHGQRALAGLVNASPSGKKSKPVSPTAVCAQMGEGLECAQGTTHDGDDSSSMKLPSPLSA